MRIVEKVIIVLFAVFLATPVLAETIYVVPGPVDGCKIITPWGNFIAVKEGSSVWVGTEAEYEHGRVGSILKKHGEREVTLEDVSDPNTHVIVSNSLPSASAGATQLYNITTMTLFGMEPDKKLHRPVKPPKTEFVSISWIQSNRASITPILYDFETRKTYKPYDTDCAGGIYASEFVLPHASLTHKVAIVFPYKNSSPGYVQLRSVAQENYKNIMQTVQENLRYRIPVYTRHVAALGPLHQLDPSIPAELDKSIPVTQEIDYEKMPNKGCPMKPNPHGKKISDRQLNQIYVGMTTEEVLQRFGNPLQCEPDPDGEIAYWWKRSSGKGGESMVLFDRYGRVAVTGGNAD